MEKPSKTATARKPQRPAKPYVGFPLFAHPSGQWGKKIRGKFLYFGSWRTDPEGREALKQFNREWPYLKEGKQPPLVDVSGGCSLRMVANEFLREKEHKLNSGELSPASFRDYYDTCELLINQFGKERLVSDLRPDDFRTFRAKLAERLGVVSLKNEINRVCIVFNFAFDNSLIDKPVSYGQSFERPSAKSLRQDRNEAGPKLFTAEEVRRLLGCPPWAPTANAQLRAMILLGINCGFGNTDVATLPQSAVNLETGWVDFPRPKTAIQRRVPLWPETVEALKLGLAARPRPKNLEDDRLCFVTREGYRFVRVQLRKQAEAEAPSPQPHVPIDNLTHRFGKLLRAMDIGGRSRRRLGFYSLRHCFETYAGESRDQVAVDAIMGHVDSSMAANYRHRISDERLRAVVETVRVWLFNSAE
jgi:integrase